MSKLTAQEGPVLLFDGVCNLCNRTVQFVIRHDKKQLFRFASLQSPTGQEALQLLATEKGMSPDSVVLYYQGRFYIKSTAALRVAWLLGGFWRLAEIFRLLPRFIRDAVYDWIARNRYKWFGKKDACMLPSPGLKERFLDI
jgi:predicted DCC family thiol-disulfide oxidoreductase YuxK